MRSATPVILPAPSGLASPLILRSLYTAVWYAAAPLVALRLLWRARRQPEYLQHLGERVGRYRAQLRGPVIWLHAVSVGETRACAPLLHALLDAHPDHSLLLTHMTPTGRAAGGCSRPAGAWRAATGAARPCYCVRVRTITAAMLLVTTAAS